MFLIIKLNQKILSWNIVMKYYYVVYNINHDNEPNNHLKKISTRHKSKNIFYVIEI
jgi:hypothetical protein